MATNLPQSSVDKSRQFEGARLAAAAYQAKAIHTALSNGLTGAELQQATQAALISNDPPFTLVQAKDFLSKYTPVAALDKDGAGAVIFRDNDSGKIAVAVRGTNKNDPKPDVYADGTIALDQLPIYQTVLIANFVLRETTPAGQIIPQYAAQGISSNADDLARAASDALANSLRGDRGIPIQLKPLRLSCVWAQCKAQAAPLVAVLMQQGIQKAGQK